MVDHKETVFRYLKKIANSTNTVEKRALNSLTAQEVNELTTRMIAAAKKLSDPIIRSFLHMNPDGSFTEPEVEKTFSKILIEFQKEMRSIPIISPVT